MLLRAHDFADALVLDRVQFVRRQMAGGEPFARLSQLLPGAESCRHGRRETADGTCFLP